MHEAAEEWTFATLPPPERVQEVLRERTGWVFRVDPVERGVVAIVAGTGDGGIQWAPVAEDVVRVEVHERITPYLSWQVDAALIALGGNPDRIVEVAPIELRPWGELPLWQRVRYGGRFWVLQVAIVVVLALPLLLITALFATGTGRRVDRDEP